MHSQSEEDIDVDLLEICPGEADGFSEFGDTESTFDGDLMSTSLQSPFNRLRPNTPLPYKPRTPRYFAEYQPLSELRNLTSSVSSSPAITFATTPTSSTSNPIMSSSLGQPSAFTRPSRTPTPLIPLPPSQTIPPSVPPVTNFFTLSSQTLSSINSPFASSSSSSQPPFIPNPPYPIFPPVTPVTPPVLPAPKPIPQPPMQRNSVIIPFTKSAPPAPKPTQLIMMTDKPIVTACTLTQIHPTIPASLPIPKTNIPPSLLGKIPRVLVNYYIQSDPDACPHLSHICTIQSMDVSPTSYCDEAFYGEARKSLLQHLKTTTPYKQMNQIGIRYELFEMTAAYTPATKEDGIRPGLHLLFFPLTREAKSSAPRPEITKREDEPRSIYINIYFRLRLHKPRPEYFCLSHADKQNLQNLIDFLFKQQWQADHMNQVNALKRPALWTSKHANKMSKANLIAAISATKHMPPPPPPLPGNPLPPSPLSRLPAMGPATIISNTPISTAPTSTTTTSTTATAPLDLPISIPISN